MELYATPRYDQTMNTTGCCAKFAPEGWNGVSLHFHDKKSVRAYTLRAIHIPLNMSGVFTRVQKHVDAHGAIDPEHVLVLSRDLLPCSSDPLRLWAVRIQSSPQHLWLGLSETFDLGRNCHVCAN